MTDVQSLLFKGYEPPKCSLAKKIADVCLTDPSACLMG